MRSLENIAQEMDLTKQAVNQILKRALEKVWCNLLKLYPDVNAFDRMQLVGEFCNITSEHDWPHFFYSFPAHIRKEILDEAIKRPEFRNLKAEDFMKRDFKKRNQKVLHDED